MQSKRALHSAAEIAEQCADIWAGIMHVCLWLHLYQPSSKTASWVWDDCIWKWAERWNCTAWFYLGSLHYRSSTNPKFYNRTSSCSSGCLSERKPFSELGSLSEKKYGIFWEFFPYGGEGSHQIPKLLWFDQVIFGMPKSSWGAKTCFTIGERWYLINLIT